jgi:hypothetical protein
MRQVDPEIRYFSKGKIAKEGGQTVEIAEEGGQHQVNTTIASLGGERVVFWFYYPKKASHGQDSNWTVEFRD